MVMHGTQGKHPAAERKNTGIHPLIIILKKHHLPLDFDEKIL